MAKPTDFYNEYSTQLLFNKARYMATQVACGWEGAIFEVTRVFGQEQYGHRMKNIKKSKV